MMYNSNPLVFFKNIVRYLEDHGYLFTIHTIIQQWFDWLIDGF